MLSPYPKPSKFSDPFQDWGGCEQRLAGILAKPLAELTLDDYSVIFCQWLPAADYEEGCYFVSAYLDFLSEASGLQKRGCDAFFWYIDYFADRFTQDGLLGPIHERLWDCLVHLTATFRVVRLTDLELEQEGICPSYREIAHLTRTVPDILDGITQRPVFDPVLRRLQTHFDRPLSAEHAHWFYELAFHTRSWLWLEPEQSDRHQTVFDFFHRLDRFCAHHDKVMASGITGGFVEYVRRLSPG
jgi:hypothetical protein